MPTNPALRRLGFGADDRVVIVHADDVGMCQATVSAFAGLMEFGLVSSGATMVPCSWFPSVAAHCREHPKADIGVHLTLTCEWGAYRWGPISTRDPASGLIDANSYFYQRNADVWEHADPEAVRLEIQAQLDRALAAGIDVTHVDSHMGTAAHPKFFQSYVQLALERRLPMLGFRLDEAALFPRVLDKEETARAVRLVRSLHERVFPIFDRIVGLPLNQPSDRIQQAKQLFDSLEPGLAMLIIHPAQDTPELRAIAPDWPSRVADYQAFTSPELRDHVRNAGIHVIGYRPLRDLLLDGQ